ncbi:glycosyltransferase family 87 protein [Puia sp. P3]|uniref:glycosyltransferase family 87 protein n=1 Tax=Puia sp. P3 TaxID=3423952 RepID=UPI003D67533F
MNIFTSKPGQSRRSKNVPIVLIAYILIAVIATAQDIFGGLKTFLPEGPAYLRYNNFRIFKLSFYHLVQGKDIYQLFPAEHWDLYKYSPAFALCFGILSWMPDSIGLLLWNLINSLCLFFGIRLLPNLSDERKSWILLFSLLEMLLSIQNTQSNGLMAGLIVLAFAFAERSKYAWSTLCIVFSFYIKIYGILALVFYLFYPGKLRLAAWTIFWMVFFALLPLAAVSTHQLGFLYNSWLSAAAERPVGVDRRIADGDHGHLVPPVFPEECGHRRRRGIVRAAAGAYPPVQRTIHSASCTSPPSSSGW